MDNFNGKNFTDSFCQLHRRGLDRTPAASYRSILKFKPGYKRESPVS
jgi:hypothetical protein